MDEVWFWKQLEQKYGHVNIHLKNILQIQNLCRQSLANLTLESIGRIAQDMRDMSDCLREAAAAGDTPMHEIYGLMYSTRPEEFRFLEGEIMCLLDLAQILRDNPIKNFIRPAKVEVARSISYQAETCSTAATNADSLKHLRNKLFAHYRTQFPHDTGYTRFILGKLRNITARFHRTGPGRQKAEVLCPICEDDGKQVKISLSMDSTGSWHVFSFTRHCNSFHSKSPNKSKAEPTVKRRKISTMHTFQDNERTHNFEKEPEIYSDDYTQNSAEDSSLLPNEDQVFDIEILELTDEDNSNRTGSENPFTRISSDITNRNTNKISSAFEDQHIYRKDKAEMFHPEQASAIEVSEELSKCEMTDDLYLPTSTTSKRSTTVTDVLYLPMSGNVPLSIVQSDDMEVPSQEEPIENVYMKDDPSMYTEEYPEGETVNIDQPRGATEPTMTENSSENIETAESIFKRAGGELILRSCESVSRTNSFKIKGINGKVVFVKKSTMLWMLSSGRFRRSNDRLRRFHRIRIVNTLPTSSNCIKNEVSIGDWIVLNHQLVCHVSGFQYQTGRSKACPLQSVPLTCPDNVKRRGIQLLGNVYAISFDGSLRICNEFHRQVDLKKYMTHIVVPAKNSSLDLIISMDTLKHLKSLKVL